MCKKKLCKIIGLFGVFCLSLGLTACGEEESVYRETTVEYGRLSVGITESGSVDIGTVDQTFDLDMNALQRVEISNSGSGSSSGMGGGMAVAMGGMGGSGGGGGMDMFSQVLSMAGGNSLVSSGSNANLVIEEVCVTVGERVEEGDALYILEEEGVAELEEELESNVSQAKADLEAVIADQNLSKTSAEYTYELSRLYGDYAAAEKENTLTRLSEAVTEKEESLSEAQALLANYQEQMTQLETEYAKACEAQANAEWSRDNTDKVNNLYYYTMYAEQARNTKSVAEGLEQEIEQLEKKIEQAQKNVTQYEKQLASAKRALEEGMLSAQETYELRMLAYNSAQETYDITLAYLEDDLGTQETIYEEASAKWEEFTSHIDGNIVRSNYSGVVTDVSLAVGDSLTTGATVVTLYDADSVSMTVTIDEDDMTDIVYGSTANISFVAYPDDIYTAVVTEISDATTDSSGNTTYDVTVTIEGDSSGLFQGMTGDITFITRESEEVAYVSNRAIIREGKKSYVKVKDEKGNITKTEVVTGFSDGINVEILEGLNVGDTVLIESKVSAE